MHSAVKTYDLKYSEEINYITKSQMKKKMKRTNYVIASECIKKLPFNTVLEEWVKKSWKKISHSNKD